METFVGARHRMEPRAGKEDEHIIGLAEDLGVDPIGRGELGGQREKYALVSNVSKSVVRHGHLPVLAMRYWK